MRVIFRENQEEMVHRVHKVKEVKMLSYLESLFNPRKEIKESVDHQDLAVLWVKKA